MNKSRSCVGEVFIYKIIGCRRSLLEIFENGIHENKKFKSHSCEYL